jgi:hypothetical protein
MRRAATWNSHDPDRLLELMRADIVDDAGPLAEIM